jgi:hypothetical protein
MVAPSSRPAIAGATVNLGSISVNVASVHFVHPAGSTTTLLLQNPFTSSVQAQDAMTRHLRATPDPATSSSSRTRPHDHHLHHVWRADLGAVPVHGAGRLDVDGNSILTGVTCSVTVPEPNQL